MQLKNEEMRDENKIGVFEKKLKKNTYINNECKMMSVGSPEFK